MIPERKIIAAIKAPQANRFVSRERGEQGKISVRTEQIDIPRLKEITEQIRQSERAFLEVVPADSLESFLNHSSITPSPETNLDLTPYMQGDTLRFTVSCLAPKAGNPNKTDQALPDLGEIALLVHFEELAQVAEKRYGKPIEFTLLTERGYMADVIGSDPEKARAFDDRVRFLSREVVVNQRVKLRDWYEAVTSLPGYYEEYARQRSELQRQFTENPTVIEEEFLQIIPTIYMTLEPADSDVRSIYSLRRSEATRRQIEKATEGTLNLMAFNRAKKNCGERERLYPNHVYGSLTPGTGKFAFYAIGPWSERYPTHGVGVLDTQTGQVMVRQRRNISERQASNHLRIVS